MSNWIKKSINNPGSLRKEMGVKTGQKIPVVKLAEAAKKDGKIGRRARLAETLSKLRKGGSGSHHVVAMNVK